MPLASHPRFRAMKAYKIAAITFMFISSISTVAQVAGYTLYNKYAAASIPDSLKTNADAVMREDLHRFTVKSVNSALSQIQEVVTVLNEEGKSHLTFAYTSDKFRTLDEAEINVYDAQGNKQHSYTKKDMQTESFGEGLVEDGKTTYFRVTAPSYPITIEKNYSIKFKGILNYPQNIIQHPYTSVGHFKYTVVVPPSLGLRYKLVNALLVPSLITTQTEDTYSWEVSNLLAQKSEKHNGSAYRYVPKILVAPNKFKLDDYEGDFTSWKSFGEWNNRLIGTRNQLSDKGKSVIQNLTKAASTDLEKAQLIYAYLQQNMRYVSIQLGIGGLQPFPADFVQEKKYGDCKALSNYMQAALQVVGIKSHYAIINAGANAEPALADFPSDPFNHIILCIPQANDSIWLECTSSTANFGELGAFTENRKALLITENGGVLVSTPTSNAASNTLSTTTHIYLNDDGTGKAETTITGSGAFKQEQVAYTYQQSDDDKRRYLIKILEWKQPDLITITNGSRMENPFRIAASLEYDQIPAFKTGGKMFLQPRLYPLFDNDVPDNNKRTQDYFFTYPYLQSDTTIFHLPQGFIAENLPPIKDLQLGFGAYHCKYMWDNNTNLLTVIAQLNITNHRIAAASYSQLVAFKKAVAASMNEKIVVKKM